ncbi:type II toxin-antitoxin system RelE/ParE family toxin [Skermanella stibiiresistens]|uniref:type II toxin-antitoxin system RelE/ParE family toxin n=1 Tax=Skermanella stibiiresistens TaxID=913326 RepID=UPI0009FD472C|nr:type II toxin-antitoxin system RelE/ParE family toxin [Skermanella stibiiresistens]
MPDTLITVVETTPFTRRADKILTTEEKKDLIDFLAANPLMGEEIVGTGGVRKVRFGSHGRGKSGGVRAIYYYYDDNMPLFALLVYGKGEQSNLTPDQKRVVTTLAATLKAQQTRRDK